MQKIIILGATGSIGTQTFEVIQSQKNNFTVLGISAFGSKTDELKKQIDFYKCEVVGIVKSVSDFTDVKVFNGEDASLELLNYFKAEKDVTVVNAIDGAKGLLASIKILENNWTLCLANKESLVIAGEYLKGIAKRENQILPIDSEHSAIHQCLMGQNQKEAKKIILTASGGPFNKFSPEQFNSITPETALNHPTWNMGKLVTINSATLFNKALEVVEAHFLFDVPISQIEPIVHPQSIIHSAVEFSDGSILAQMSNPDMKIPISLAINNFAHKAETAGLIKEFSFSKDLTFDTINPVLNKSIELAKKAIELSNFHMSVLNAANEECVFAFLNKKISFLQIFEFIEKVLLMYNYSKSTDAITQIFESDLWARETVKKLCL